MLERFDDFTAAISASQKYILKIKSHYMREFGLKAAHVPCLHLLNRYPDGLTPTRICELCKEDKASVSKALAALCAKGYVQATVEGGKKYKARYSLTKAGREISRRVEHLIVHAVGSCGKDLTPQERAIFYKSFQSIVENMAVLCAKLEAKGASGK